MLNTINIAVPNKYICVMIIPFDPRLYSVMSRVPCLACTAGLISRWDFFFNFCLAVNVIQVDLSCANIKPSKVLQ